MRRRSTCFIVGIAGGTGSGKTTVARASLERVGPEKGVLIQHDSYYKDRSHLDPMERERINYDHPDALDCELLIQHLVALRAGEPIQQPLYDFKTHTRKSETRLVVPRPIVVAEGILIFVDERLRRLMDLRVYVDTEPDIRFIRRAQRDMAERGRTFESVVRQYLETVRPMHAQFVEPTKQYADIVILEGYNVSAIETISACLKEFISSQVASNRVRATSGRAMSDLRF